MNSPVFCFASRLYKWIGGLNNEVQRLIAVMRLKPAELASLGKPKQLDDNVRPKQGLLPAPRRD